MNTILLIAHRSGWMEWKKWTCEEKNNLQRRRRWRWWWKRIQPRGSKWNYGSWERSETKRTWREQRRKRKRTSSCRVKFGNASETTCTVLQWPYCDFIWSQVGQVMRKQLSNCCCHFTDSSWVGNTGPLARFLCLLFLCLFFTSCSFLADLKLNLIQKFHEGNLFILFILLITHITKYSNGKESASEEEDTRGAVSPLFSTSISNGPVAQSRFNNGYKLNNFIFKVYSPSHSFSHPLLMTYFILRPVLLALPQLALKIMSLMSHLTLDSANKFKYKLPFFR